MQSEQLEMEAEGMARFSVPITVELQGGSVLVTLGNGVLAAVAGKTLRSMVTELIESREARHRIGAEDLLMLDDVRHELSMASDLLAQRVALERERMRAVAERIGGGGIDPSVRRTEPTTKQARNGYVRSDISVVGQA